VTAEDLTPIEKQLALQNAMARARQYLQVEMPVEAVDVLETEISRADGNSAFLTLLRQAYASEFALRMKEPTRNADRLNQLRRNLDRLLAPNNAPELFHPPAPPPTTAPASLPQPAFPDTRMTPAAPSTTPAVLEAVARPAPGIDSLVTDPNSLADATAFFKKGDYVQAERLFALTGAAKLNAEQKAAWAYCRIRIGAGKVNAPQCDAATAIAVEKDVQDAIKLVPQHTELLKVAQQVMAAANLKSMNREGGVAQVGPAAGANARAVVMNATDTVETASFRVRSSANRDVAEAVARAAETARREIFERWSGPPGASWEPKCEIVIHPTAEAYSQATGRPAGSTGYAMVRLSNGVASERRIDLRADDAVMVANALPRELTHIILADLFPDKPPPRWAEEGMAVLAGTPEEASRYSQTLRRCAREGEWFGLGQLMEMKDFPAEKITGFYCESVALTDYLVHLRGERNFNLFLRDSQRYGVAQSLKRQYGIEGTQALEAAWNRSVLDISRGQAP
jgi:hypothetical protein